MSFQAILATGSSILQDLLSPRSYGDIRIHHVVVGYGILSALRKYLEPLTVRLLSNLSEVCIPLIHAGLIPDFLIRYGIRCQLANHLQTLNAGNVEDELASKLGIVQKLSTMEIAVNTDEANEQHYEVPAEFYSLCLGPHKKYSSGYWASPDVSFEESERAMLALYCQRANVQDGMSIVDLGCGWGSLSLYLLEHFPNAKITGVSNSHSQRLYITQTAKDRGLKVENLTILTVR